MHALESLHLADLNMGNALNDLLLPSSQHFREIYIEDHEATNVDLAFFSPVANTITHLDFRKFYALTQLTNNYDVVLDLLMRFEVRMHIYNY